MFNNIYKGKKVFVTGHTGFKGSWLSLWLTKLGAEVGGYSSRLPSSPALFEVSEIEKDIKHTEGDVRNLKDLKTAIEAFQPDIVFHLAANAIVRDCYDDPIEAFESNVMGTINLLTILRDIKSVRSTVLITSDKCYENVEWKFGYRETDHLGGKDPYSASKACAEIAASSLIRSYFSEDSTNTISTARAGNVIGGGDWANHRLVPDSIRSWADNKSVTIRSPKATRPWQHVLEPLSGYLTLGAALYEKQVSQGESYNFGPLPTIDATVEDLLVAMKKIWKQVDWKVDQSDIGSKKEAGLLKLNCDLALSNLNWKATLDFNQTVDMTTQWYLRYYKEDSTNMKEFTLSQIEEYENLAKSKGQHWTN